MNGGGYPNGITGDQICIEARIISVADAYDALTTDRSYRKGFTAQKAVEILESESGWKYDSVVLEKLFEALNEEKIV
jgi:HD-GYP domain-containing protein (c-di-GMP phosphodiesterase class II)